MRYLHSDIQTMERTQLIRDLRLGEFDVLVGINLLREGLEMCIRDRYWPAGMDWMPERKISAK